MAVKINSENLNPKRRLDLSKIKRIARTVLAELKKDNVELNIVFLDNRGIRKLNRKYLKKDAATDVIAFPPEGTLKKGGREKWPEKKMARQLMGEVAISSERSGQNAKVYGVSFSEETARYVIHGILHLAGYKDATKKEKAGMRKKEDVLLQKIGKFA